MTHILIPIIYIRKLNTFEQIKNGKKTIEIRKMTKLTSNLITNQIIKLKNNNEHIICVIKKIIKNKSFDEIINSVSLNEVNTNITNISNAIIYYSSYYPNIKNEKFCAIFLQLIN